MPDALSYPCSTESDMADLQIKFRCFRNQRCIQLLFRIEVIFNHSVGIFRLTPYRSAASITPLSRLVPISMLTFIGSLCYSKDLSGISFVGYCHSWLLFSVPSSVTFLLLLSKKIFRKKMFCIDKSEMSCYNNNHWFCSRRDGRVVDGAGLENQ